MGGIQPGTGGGNKMKTVIPVLLLAATAAWSAGAQSQTYPAKTVRVVIPWPPGGSNDIVGRVVMQKLAESMGQSFVIENRAGASGVVGSEVVARAPADGYTLMVHSTTHLGNAHLYRKLGYDTLRDFGAVALLAAQPGVLVAHPSLPVRNVKEFIALAKARKGQVNYSSSGNGSAPHLSIALLASMADLQLVHVPYKGGAPQVTALVSGETHVSLATIATVVTQIKAGRLRPLGVSSAQRSGTMPDVPTIAEAGVPGYEMSPWIGVFTPAGVPATVVQRLNGEINKTLKLPDIAKVLSNSALDPWVATADEFAARIKVDYEKYGRLIKLTGATVD